VVASLYTAPEHVDRTISDVDVSAADFVDFGTLTFRRAGLTRVRWQRCNIRRLQLDRAAWREVRIEGCHLGKVVAAGGTVGWTGAENAVETYTLQKSRATIVSSESLLESVTVEGGTVILDGEASKVGSLGVSNAVVRLGLTKDEVLRRGMGAAGENHQPLKRLEVDRVSAAESAVVINRSRAVCRSITALSSLVIIQDGDGRFLEFEPTRWHDGTGSDLGQDNIVVYLAPCPVRELATLSTGVFGQLDLDGGISPLLGCRAWGVLDGGNDLGRLGLPDEIEGVREGDVVVLRHTVYRRLIASGGPLASLARLTNLCEAIRSDTDAARLWEGVASLRTALREEHAGFEADRCCSLSQVDDAPPSADVRDSS
jgi:hypothetical protein